MSDGKKLSLLRVRSASSIFCDDIRREDTGKLLMLGVYDSALLTPALPATVGGLKVHLTVTTPISLPFTYVAIKVFLNDAVLTEVEVNVSADQPVPAEDDGDQEDWMGARVQRFQGIIDLGPLTYDKPSTLRVRVFTDTEIIPAGTLRLDAVNNEPEAVVVPDEAESA